MPRQRRPCALAQAMDGKLLHGVCGPIAVE
jgi:hypothetical protein